MDDGWWSHPKVIGLPLAARGLWISALSWSCHQRTDEVPKAALPMFGANQDEATHLVEVGLWKDVGSVYLIHDWHQYQDLSLSEKRAIAGAKGGRKSGEARRRTKTEANDEPGTHPIPSQPNPESNPATSRKRDQLFEAVCAAVGADWTRMPKNERAKVNAAVKQLREIDVKPDEVPKAAARWSKMYPEARLTAPALATHWSSIAPQRARRQTTEFEEVPF